MRAWAVLLCLGHVIIVLLSSPAIQAKRFDPSMVDPLSRRSSLDKNFMRFGRSSPSYTEEGETDDPGERLSGAETNKEDNFLRSMRGKDNFIRFGRGKNDNYMRFGRGKQDNFMRFGKSLDNDLIRFTRGKQDSYMRFGRGKENNFMRFGRGKENNYMRFGRSKQDNFMRFGRGKQDNFMRLGRGKQDSYMRFGRGKQDSYMRFGRSYNTIPSPQTLKFDGNKMADVDVSRDPRGKQDNYMRFGKNLSDDVDMSIPLAARSSGSNFMRFGRARPDNFMRFGKSTDKINSPPLNEEYENTKENRPDKTEYPETSDTFERETKSKDSNLIRFQRQPPTKDSGFMRFGRNAQVQPETPLESELIPQRLKRSISTVYESQDRLLPENLQDGMYGHILIPFSSFPDDLEEEYSPQEQQEDFMNRKKRSVSYDSSTSLPLVEEDSSIDYISAKLRVDSPAKPGYHTSLLSAGLPNVIVGPEFSLLPDLDPPSTMLKRGRPGDQNFLRLG